MAFGLIMLALTCVGAYIYFFHMKPSSELAVEGSRPASLAAKAEELKTLIPKATNDEIRSCSLGTLIQIKDVGLEMIQVDGIVTERHLMSGGPTRWSITSIDQGNRIFKIHENHTSQKAYFLETGSETFLNLNLNSEQFEDIHATSIDQFQWQGQTWMLNGKISARYCNATNQLEQIPCLVWFYEDPTGTQRIQIIRFPDQNATVQILEKFERSQVNLVTHLS